MNRSLYYLFTFIILFCIGLFIFVQSDFFQSNISNIAQVEEQVPDLPHVESEQIKKAADQILSGTLYNYANASTDTLLADFGEPSRKDMTPYGYKWWIYTDNESYYIQFGVEKNKVETIFATGEDIEIDPFEIGMSYEQMSDTIQLKQKVTFQDGLSFYSFLLNDEELQMTPLIQLSDDLFIQLYFDTFTSSLSAIRLASGETLVNQRFYEMEYRGKLPDENELSDEDWAEIERGIEQQILDLTNIYRRRHDVQTVKFDEAVASVAKKHSKEMHEENYFSHTSHDGRGLKERLDENDIYYFAAGENIAAQYTDAPQVVEGWLNSDGHRETLLEKDYTHLGVGVYRLYYTQNFITKHH